MVKYYTVKSGDNLTKISNKYGVTIDAIMAANKFITNKNNIKVGWTLNIPEPAKTETEPANTEPPYKKIGKRVVAVLDVIEKSPEFAKLMEVLNNGNGN